MRGRGTGEAQRKFGREEKQIIFPTKYANLSIVQACCHLGIILSKCGRVVASSEISRSTKLQLARALLDGILICGAGTWLELSGGVLGSVGSGYPAESSVRSVNISVVQMEMVGRTSRSDLSVA